jgi:hypothetical protein
LGDESVASLIKGGIFEDRYMQLTKISASSTISWKGPPGKRDMLVYFGHDNVKKRKWQTFFCFLQIPLHDIALRDAYILCELHGTFATSPKLCCLSSRLLHQCDGILTAPMTKTLGDRPDILFPASKDCFTDLIIRVSFA